MMIPKEKSELPSYLETFYAGLFLGIFIGFIIVSLFFIGDTNDIVHTNALGKVLCHEYGLNYDYREFQFNSDTGETEQIPIIYCKNNESTINYNPIVRMTKK